MLKKNKGYLFALVAIFLWGASAPIPKLLLNGLDTIQVLCLAMFFASIALVLINTFSGKMKMLREYKVKDYIIMFFTGVIGVLVYGLLFYSAIDYLPAQEAFIINYLWPIMIVFFAVIILKEKITPRKVIALFLSFFGIIILITKGDFSSINLSSPLGILFGIIGASIYGLFSVLVKKYKYDKILSMMFYYIFSFIVSYIFMNLFSNMPTLSINQFLGIAFVGVFNSAIAFTCWALALKYGDTSKISNLAFIAPFLSLVSIAIVLKEKISIFSVVGLVIIVIGILIQNKKEQTS